MRFSRWIAWPAAVYFLISLPAVYTFYGVIIRQAGQVEPQREWVHQSVVYSPVSVVEYEGAEYGGRMRQRVLRLIDSLSDEYQFAENLPVGFAPYERRTFCQPSPNDTELVNVLELLDLRLDCGCPEQLDRFYLLRLVIDPGDLSVTVSNDEVRPWRTYVPYYRPSET